MVSVQAPQEFARVLEQAEGLVEVQDASGTVIGFFAPASMQQAALHAKAAAQAGRARLTNGASLQSKLDPIEIERRKAAKGIGHATREVFEHLLTLTQDERLRADLLQRIHDLKVRDECAAP